jgi:hypothetical protein
MVHTIGNNTPILDNRLCAFYRDAMAVVQRAGIDFLGGGAYALGQYTGIERHTKDLDLFVRPRDAGKTLETLAAAGYRTELSFAHWLGKAFGDDGFVDVIFSSGNGIAQVDDAWFVHAVDANVLGMPIRICPVEEMIWSKAFVMERERYDGADIAHLLLFCGHRLDWKRLVRRFGAHGCVLLNHLLLFGYIYPNERAIIPDAVLNELWQDSQNRPVAGPGEERLCRGTLLSREQYLMDVQHWGYRDARLQPTGNLDPEAIERWTAAIWESGNELRGYKDTEKADLQRAQPQACGDR